MYTVHMLVWNALSKRFQKLAQGNFYGRMVMSYVMPWDVSPSKQQRDVKVGCPYKTYSNPYGD